VGRRSVPLGGHCVNALVDNDIDDSARSAHCRPESRASANQWRTRRGGQFAQWYHCDALGQQYRAQL
jgi:hypothetical protein